MKKIIIYLSMIAFATLYSTTTFAQEMVNSADLKLDNFQALKVEKNQYFNAIDKEDSKGSGFKPYKRWEAFYTPRLYPNGDFRTPLSVYKEYQNAIQNKNNSTLQKYSASWQEIGPKTVPTDVAGGGSGLGRVNCIEMHPTNKNEFWVGSAMGGAWHTTNRGNTWTCPDFTSFLSMGVSDIKIARSEPNVIYIATGDSDGASMTTGYSIGIIKSIDNGKTWEITGLASAIEEGFLVSSLYVDPDSSNVVLAATSKGIYRSSDGGEKWDKRSITSFFREIEPIYGNDEILLSTTASNSGNSSVYRSEDGGETWNNTWTDGLAVRMRFATTPADPNRVYMIAVDKTMGSNNKSYGMLGFYKSTDAGVTWNKSKTPLNLLGWNRKGNDWGGQGYYDLAIAANPTNADEVVVGGVNIWKTADGGDDWEFLTNWYTSSTYPYVHADQHYFTYNPKNNDFIVANDGGIYINGNDFEKESWEDVSNGVSAGQFYRFDIANTKDLMCVVGAQDNGSSLLYEGKWLNIGGGDGMDCAINQNDRRVIYWSTYYGSTTATFDGLASWSTVISSNITGEAGDWTAPMLLDPTNNDIVYVGFQNVWKSTDKGVNWNKYGTLPTATKSTLNCIEVPEADNSIMYASSANALMRRVGNGNWKTIYGAGNYITSIHADKKDPYSVWVTLSGFNAISKVLYLQSDGKGAVTAINYSQGLPNVPVNDILIMEDNQTFFAATDVGVFVKESIEQPWKWFNNDMPHLIINQLKYNKNNSTLYACTFARGVSQSTKLNCSIVPPIVKASGTLDFCYGDSVTLSLTNASKYKNAYWSTGDTLNNLTVYNDGVYYVTVENEVGCVETSDMFHVNVLDFNEVKAKSSNGAFAFCDNEDSLRLSGTLGYNSYLWSTGETSIRIYIKEPGDYWLECTAKNGCIGRHEFTIIESAYPEKPEIVQAGKQLVCTVENAYSYQWFNGSQALNGATKQKYTPGESGKYRVEVYSEGGCAAASEEFEITVSVNDNNQDISYLNIYPNPNHGFITIDMALKGTFTGEIVLMDLEGKELRRLSNIVMSNHYTHNLDLSELANGAYIVRLSVGENTYIHKIIKD